MGSFEPQSKFPGEEPGGETGTGQALSLGLRLEKNLKGEGKGCQQHPWPGNRKQNKLANDKPSRNSRISVEFQTNDKSLLNVILKDMKTKYALPI